MTDYLILTFADGETVVIHDDLRFDTNLKPELSFAFDALYFEPPSGHCVKRADGESIPLSEAEMEECAAYCRGYAETADYPVYAWNRDNICVGRILKSEAEAKGYGFTVLDVPPYPVSRRNEGSWEEMSWPSSGMTGALWSVRKAFAKGASFFFPGRSGTPSPNGLRPRTCTESGEWRMGRSASFPQTFA